MRGFVITSMLALAAAAWNVSWTLSAESYGSAYVDIFHNTWSSAPPPGRKDFAAGYDRNTGLVVIFGGRGGGTFGDTWLYNMTNGFWTQLTPSPSPSARFSMVSGVLHRTSGINSLIVSTGESTANGRSFFNDVWEFSFSTRAWESLSTTATGSFPAVRYGAAGGVIGDLLYVTHGFAKIRYDDTFTFNLTSKVWTDISPALEEPTSRPFARCLAGGCVFTNSAGDAHVFMSGGCGSGGYGPCPAPDAWTLINNAAAPARWSRISASTTCTHAKLYSAAAPLPSPLQGVVLFGGNGWVWGSGDRGEVSIIEYNSDGSVSSWRRLVPGPMTTPPRLDGPYLLPVVESESGNAYYLVLGGYSLDDSSYSTGVWRLDVQQTVTGGATQLDCPSYFDIRLVHGILMYISWAVILPIGVHIARFLRFAKPKGLWFRLHRALQVTGVTIQIGGFVAAMFVNQAGKFMALGHAAVGLLLFAIGIQQPVNAYFRPEPPTARTRRRICWEYWHKYAGRIGICLGLLQPFWGITYYSTDQRTHSGWFIWHSIWVSILVCTWTTLTCSGRPGQANPSFIALQFRRLFNIPDPDEQQLVGRKQAEPEVTATEIQLAPVKS